VHPWLAFSSTTREVSFTVVINTQLYDNPGVTLLEDAMNSSGFESPRTEPRICVRVPVLLRFGWKNSEETKASTVDMSERGMSVYCRDAFNLGMDVKAIFEKCAEDLKVYRVVWSRNAEPFRHGFNVGLALKLPRIAASQASGIAQYGRVHRAAA